MNNIKIQQKEEQPRKAGSMWQHNETGETAMLIDMPNGKLALVDLQDGVVYSNIGKGMPTNDWSPLGACTVTIETEE